MDFERNYQIYDQTYGSELGYSNRIYRIIPNFNEEDVQNQLIVLLISKNLVNEITFTKYKNLKYLNILQPNKYCNSEYEHYLIYFDLFNHRLNQEKLNNIIHKEGYRILLQLALTFAEFQGRNFYWPLTSIDHVYYIEGIVYLSLLEYDFNQFHKPQDSLANFQNFVNRFFTPTFQELIKLQKMQDFYQVINYLFEKNGNIHIQSLLDPEYEKLLKYLLNIDKLQQIYNGNCVVKSFTQPTVFSYNFTQLTKEIVYKQTKIYGNDADKQIILKQIERDIELMELFNKDETVAVCFTYFRVLNFVFLLYRRFSGTLAQGFKIWPKEQQTVEQIRKSVYTFAARAAKSLMCLHEKNIIHRDLNPENIFIDNIEISCCQVYIGDFDCSKQVQNGINISKTKDDSCYTPKYDPPENIQTLKYDIFQLGLIILTVANKGNYIGNQILGPRGLKEDQFYNFYHRQSIEKILSSINYDQIFLDILAKCLLKDPDQRPDIKVLYDTLNQLNLKNRIRLVIPNSYTRYIQQFSQPNNNSN